MSVNSVVVIAISVIVAPLLAESATLEAAWVVNSSFSHNQGSGGINSLLSLMQVKDPSNPNFNMGGLVVYTNNSLIYGRNATTGAIEFAWKAPEGGSQDGTGPKVLDAQFPIFQPNMLIFKSYSIQHNQDWYWGFDIFKKQTVWNISVCNTIDSYPKCWSRATPTDQFLMIWEIGRQVMQVDVATGQIFGEATVPGQAAFSEKDSHGWAAGSAEPAHSAERPGIFFVKPQTPNAFGQYDYHFFNLVISPSSRSTPANLSETACVFAKVPGYQHKLLGVGDRYAMFQVPTNGGEVKIFNVSNPACSFTQSIDGSVWGSLLRADTVRPSRGGWLMAHKYDNDFSVWSPMNFTAGASRFDFYAYFPFYHHMNQFSTMRGVDAVGYETYDKSGVPDLTITNCQSGAPKEENKCSFQIFDANYSPRRTFTSYLLVPGDDYLNYVINHITKGESPSWRPLNTDITNIFIPYYNASSDGPNAPAMTFLLYDKIAQQVTYNGNLMIYEGGYYQEIRNLKINQLKQVGKPVVTQTGNYDTFSIPILLSSEEEGINGETGWSAIVMVQN